MEIDLTGRNILITGGTRGIGRRISLTLAQAGARVGAIYRGEAAAAERTLSDLRALPPEDPFILQADIADEAQAIQAVRQALTNFQGALDGLVLDAAAGAGGPMIEMKTEDWKRTFDVNVHGAFYVVRAAAPAMRPNSSLVLISSGAGHDYLEGLSSYGASKAAVNHLAGILAQELGPKGVRVNVVSPGHTDKSDTDPNAYSAHQKQIAETTALRRIGTAQDVANVVLFFSSDLSSFVTGQWLRVNGGRV